MPPEPKYYYFVKTFEGGQLILHSDTYPKGYQMVAPGETTLEESKKKWKMSDFDCSRCDAPIYGCYSNLQELLDRRLCFDCNYWVKLIEKRNELTSVRADGKHYQIAPENPNTNLNYKGFGGRKFTIKFNDGRIVTTSNLWSQGSIPERFRGELSDNAEVIEG